MLKSQVILDLNPELIEHNREVVNRFIMAMTAMEVSEVALVLSEGGIFNDMSKSEFLNWLSEKFAENIEDKNFLLSAKVRFCDHCMPGNPTVLFNQGFFPKEVDGYSGVKGFMLDIKYGQIYTLEICKKWITDKECAFRSTCN